MILISKQKTTMLRLTVFILMIIMLLFFAVLNSYSYNGGAVEFSMFTLAKILKCHFQANKALGSGGAIYVTMKSELKVYDSQFTLNTAFTAGSVSVIMGESLVQSCNFTSDSSSKAGGCILLKAANGTVTQSHFLGCRSDTGGTVAVTERAILLLEEVTINQSNATLGGGALRVSFNSTLSVRNSMIKDSTSKSVGGGIICIERSEMYLDSMLISSCSSSDGSGCVYSFRCTLTMDNITIIHVPPTHVIHVRYSTIKICNTFTQNDTTVFLRASSSHVSFWNFNLSGTRIDLDKSVTEFRHTLFIRQDETCLIRGNGKSSINLKSVYITGPVSGLVCQKAETAVHGNVSSRTFTFTLILFA